MWLAASRSEAETLSLSKGAATLKSESRLVSLLPQAVAESEGRSNISWNVAPVCDLRDGLRQCGTEDSNLRNTLDQAKHRFYSLA